MAESKYHKRIINHIYRFGEEMNNKYIAAYRGSKTPILLNAPQAKRKKILPSL